MNRLLIVGHTGPSHVGSRLYDAARELGILSDICNSTDALSKSRILQLIYWRLLGHRPVHLESFSRQVIDKCVTFRPDCVLVTGITPPSAYALHILNQMGIVCVNYLTDDPWSSVHHSPWFL